MKSLAVCISIVAGSLWLVGCSTGPEGPIIHHYPKHHSKAYSHMGSYPCSEGYRHCTGVVQRHKHIERWKPNYKVPHYVKPDAGYSCAGNCTRRGADTRFSYTTTYRNGYEDGCRTAWTGGMYKNAKLMSNSYPYQLGWEAGFNQCRYDRSHVDYDNHPKFSYIPY